MEFWKRVNAKIKERKLKQLVVAEECGISYATFKGWITKEILPDAVEAVKIAKVLGTSVEYLVTGKASAICADLEDEAISTYGYRLFDSKGNESQFDDRVVLVPILSQKVAAGNGQEYQSAIDIIGRLPFLARMLRGEKPANARALEVRGDSMTGVQLFDGDLVVYVPGVIRGDGIYVLQVSSELLVKRVQFDLVSRKLRIISENPRYPDRVESADGQTVEIVGKVFGWLHAHPY